MDLDGLLAEHATCPEGDCRICHGCSQQWPCTVASLVTRLRILRPALERAQSYLSVIRHRGGVTWGGMGFPTEYEVDRVLGQIERALQDSAASPTAPPSHRMGEVG